MNTLPYHYIAGPDRLGIGTDNLVMASYGVPFAGVNYGPQFNVTKSIAPLETGAYYPNGVYGPTVTLQANGAYLSNGTIALQALAQYNKQNNITQS